MYARTAKVGLLLAVVNAQYTFNKYTESCALCRGYSEKTWAMSTKAIYPGTFDPITNASSWYHHPCGSRAVVMPWCSWCWFHSLFNLLGVLLMLLLSAPLVRFLLHVSTQQTRMRHGPLLNRNVAAVPVLALQALRHEAGAHGQPRAFALALVTPRLPMRRAMSAWSCTQIPVKWYYQQSQEKAYQWVPAAADTWRCPCWASTAFAAALMTLKVKNHKIICLCLYSNQCVSWELAV